MASATPSGAGAISEGGSASPSPGSKQNGARPARRSRPSKPNFKHIHRFPLPVHVHPLPPLIPHNPLSVISVLLSYLTYFISPPGQDEIYSAYFDADTSSVQVTDEKAMKALWEMGFFGKGSLSRSEPSWLEREKKRRGLLGGNTSEDITSARRSERRDLKLERARMEKIIVEERLKAEAAAQERGTAPLDEASANGAPDVTIPEKFSVKKARQDKFLASQRSHRESEENTTPDSPVGSKTPNGNKTVRFSPVVEQKEFPVESSVLHLPDSVTNGDAPDEEPLLENEEHLQLSNEEAFFLVYGLGALQIYDLKQNSVISPTSLFALLRQHSYFPPRDPAAQFEPDDPFVVSYVVYHHFRSLGWIVRSGVKFGVDYLLYNRGPVFSHAEFALVIIPAYSHLYWSESEERRDYTARKQARSWWWLHCVNRVQAQVKKSLVMCYVEVPPPQSSSSTAADQDIGAVLSGYQVREISLKRWTPNRTRD